MPIQESEIELIKRVDPWAWVYYNKMILSGGPYTPIGHEFQVDIFQCDAPRQCAKKSPQFAGFTEILVSKILHGMIHKRYPQGAFYMFPTSDEVTVFSKSRFKPYLAKNSTSVGRYVKDTDSTDVKQIGDAFLFFRGARMTQTIEGTQKSSSKLKGLPADIVVFDEYDEMDPKACLLALGRLDHSERQEEWYLANPTVPNWGIDAKYNLSDQRVWALKCGHCGKRTCMELEFPNSLKRRGGEFSSSSTIIDTDNAGDVFRSCKKCGREIFPKDGEWVAQYPGRSKDLVGWWISHLNSKFTQPVVILDEYENPLTDMVQFYNRRLGKAYADTESQLTTNQVYACCGYENMAAVHSGPCAMGVDVGKKLHISIGTSPYAGFDRIVKCAELSTFADAMDLAKRFNVRCAVFDLLPETRKVREFRARVNYPVYGCSYSEHRLGTYTWNERDGVVTVNRTEIFDATHALFNPEAPRIELPQRCTEIEEYALQLCNTAKKLEENKETGSKVYRYVKLGPEHYRNSLNYLHLALLKMQGITMPIPSEGPKPEEYYYD
jgi:hypothetical protein